MMGDLRASLYDVFGYSLPGSAGLLAIVLIFWAGCHASEVGDLTHAGDGIVVSAVIVAAYLVGHLLHGIGNLIPALNRVTEETLLTKAEKVTQTKPVSAAHAESDAAWWKDLFAPVVPISPALLDAMNVQLGNYLDVKELKAREKMGFIDEARSLAPREGDREVYVYREGFYRGITVATALVGIGLLCRAAVAPTTCVMFAAVVPENGVPLAPGMACLSSEEVAVLGLLSLSVVPVFRKRMERFARYRIERAILLWLDYVAYSKAKTDS